MRLLSSFLEVLAVRGAWGPLLSGAVALLCTLAFTPLVIRAAHRWGGCWLVRPQEDRWHRHTTAHGGGLAIAVALAVALVAASVGLGLSWVPWPVWAGGMLLFAVGLADDLRGVGPGKKLLAQVAAAVLVLAAGYAFWARGPGWLSVPLTFLWVVGLTNALNLIDGMDGLAAGIAAIAALVLAALAGIAGEVALACAAMALAGAAAGFLVFNLSPARIFMGDCGSMLLGFALAVLALAVQGHSGAAFEPAAVLIPVLVLAVPIFDVVFVTVGRVLHGRPVTQGGNDHLMHRLASLGLSERRTVGLLYGLGALLGSLALAFHVADRSLFYAAVLFAVVALAVFGVHVSRVEAYAPAQNGAAAGDSPENDSPEEGAARTATQKLGAVLQAVVGRYWKTPVSMVGDLLLVTGAFLLAHALRFEDGMTQAHVAQMGAVLPSVIGVKLFVFYVAGLYKGIWRHAGTPELVRVAGASLAASALVAFGLEVVRGPGSLSTAVFVLDWLVTTMAVGGMRFGFRGLRQYFILRSASSGKRVLLYGAGPQGMLMLRHLRGQDRQGLAPVGFLDDDPRKCGHTVQGLPVVGTPEDLADACAAHRVEGVLVSPSTLTAARERRLARACRALGVDCYHVDLTIRTPHVPSGDGAPR